MSAITGILNSHTDDLRFIRAMTDLLAHRGPHGDGILLVEQSGHTTITHNALPSTASNPGRIALGHRLLRSVGDGTAQPLSTEQGRYWIALDGAIYNYRELRESLQEAGHVFTTDSDAEVALAAYKAHGTECFTQFNGAYAMAIIDTHDRTLTLARDASGLKPLYYWAHRGRMTFASEIKALFAIPETRAKLDRQSLSEFIRYGRIMDEQRTSFAHISALLPGHFAVMGFDAPVPVKPVAFTAPAASETLNEEASIARYRELFSAALERQRSSPLGLGTCLTGGLASTPIANALRQQLGSNVLLNSFAAVCEQPGYDERPWITMANSTAQTLTNWIAPTAEDFALELDTMLWHHEEPFATVGAYGQWCVARAAREAQLDVLLDGHGAHENLNSIARPGLLQRLLPSNDRTETRVLARLAPSLSNTTASAMPATAPRATDRSCMAFGVEVRMPYFDQQLQNFTKQLPANLRHDRAVMRRALAEWLPESIGTREAMPAYHMPLLAWMQQAILPMFLRDIKHARLLLVPLVHGGELRELVTKQLDRPDIALMPLLFRLFIANRWMQRFNVAPVS